MKICLAVSLACALSLSAIAQPAAPLSLDACLTIAAGHHPAVAAAHAGVTAATESLGEARAPYYPSLDLNASYHRWQRRAFLPSGLTIPGRTIPELIGPLNDWNGGVASRITLYDAGERRAGVDAAHARRAVAEAEASIVQADLRLAVQSAFYALAAAQELNTVAEKNLARTEAHQRLAVARREAGAVPQADVLRLDAEVASARLQLINAGSRVRVATGRLNTAMGRGADTPLTIAPPASPMAPPTPSEIEAATTRALARRPEITSSEKRSEAARAAVSAAQASRAPKIRADAMFGLRDTSWLPDTREWQAGLSVDFPIFDGSSRVRRLARTKAELAREQAAFEQRRLVIRDEVWSTASELERAWAAIAANETGVKASTESLRVVRERYQNGAALITDLLDTQTALARAESSLAEARWSYLAARAAFDRATGAGG